MKIQSYKKNGKTLYKFSIYIRKDELTGKEIRTRRQGFKTKKDAEIAYLRIKTQSEEKRLNKNNYTFQDVYDMWIKQYELLVAPSTFKQTKQRFRDHVLPVFGDMQIDKIKYQHCQRFVDENAIKFSKPRFLKSVLKEIFNHAIKLGITSDNPSINVQFPKIKKINEKNMITSGIKKH